MRDTLLLPQPLLQGQQHIAGLWWPSRYFTEGQRRANLVQHWRTGALAYRFEQGDVLIFLRPFLGRCDDDHGWPLIRHKQKLYSAKLPPLIQAELGVADIYLILGNRIHSLSLQDGEPLAVWEWIETKGYQLACAYQAMQTVSDQALAAEVLVPVDGMPKIEALETVLGQAMTPRPRLQRLGQSLQKARLVADQRAENEGVSQPFSLMTWGLMMMLSLLMVGALIHHFSDGVDPHEQAAQASSGMSGYGWMVVFILCFTALFYLLKSVRRLCARWRRQIIDYVEEIHSKEMASITSIGPKPPSLLQRALVRLAILSQWSSSQQARYLARMMKQFNGGDWEGALKQALPIDSRDPNTLIGGLGIPKPRASLTLSEKCYGTQYCLSLDWHTMTHLRHLYRAGFEQLNQQGRIQEAAFVLVELLSDVEEGVAYLEQKEGISAALKLALAREANPATIVRLCCLAENWGLAIQVARRNHAFAQAVAGLTKAQPELAIQLRKEWARALADQGSWLEAVAVIWPLIEQRGQALQWLQCCEQAGGVLAAEALAQRAILLPDTLAVYQGYIERLQRQSEPAWQQQRLALAKSILKEDHHPRLAPLVQALSNRLLQDYQKYGGLTKKQLATLLKYDPVLKADLANQGVSAGSQHGLAKRSGVMRWSMPLAGQHTIVDVAILYNGHYVLALGAAGVLILNEQGSQQAYHLTPCTDIVLSENRQYVLFLAPQGNAWRVTKFEALSGQMVPLGLLMMTQFAKQYDGLNWSVVQQGCVRVLAVNERFKIVWQVDHGQHQVEALSVSAKEEYWLIRNEHQGLEYWVYTLPERRLSERSLISSGQQSTYQHLLGAGGLFRLYYDAFDTESIVVYSGRYEWANCSLSQPELTTATFLAMQIQINQDWVVLVKLRGTTRKVIQFYECRTGQLCAEVDWPVASAVHIRPMNHDWVLFDEEGRLLHLNTASAQVCHISVC